MSICFIGDVHGELDGLRKNMKRFRKLHPEETFIQVGDLGLGFPKSQSPDFPKHFSFIRGNHDQPAMCRRHPRYLGDYGVTEIEGHKVFFMSGAWSIDRAMRTEHIDWWAEEELSNPELDAACNLYVKEKPEIVITHDAPQSIAWLMLNQSMIGGWGQDSFGTPVVTRTGEALTAMFDAYQPKLWMFGHWHRSFVKNWNGTKFICADIMNFVRYDEITF